MRLASSYSNLAVLKGGAATPQLNMLKQGETIYVHFNQPVQPNSVVVGLTDEYGSSNLSIAKGLRAGTPS